MNDEGPDATDAADDPALDALLRGHLDAALASQLGRARARFEALTPATVRPRWSLWSIRAGSMAACAAAAAVLALTTRHTAPPPPVQIATPIATTVNRNTEWQTVDQGVVELGDGSQARRLLQRRVDRLRYFDPVRQADVEYAVPREQTLYVKLAAY